MKALVLETASLDAGNYNGMKDFRYGEIVECEYSDSRKNSILVPASEMIRLGGDVKAFSQFPNKTQGFLWGAFKIVEEK